MVALFITVGREKSVSTGGEGASAGTQGVCPHIRAAWPWGRGQGPAEPTAGCSSHCSFQPQSKECHFPAFSQVFLIPN